MVDPLSVEVAVVCEVPIPEPAYEQALADLVRHALRIEGRTGDWEVSLALMSDDDLRRLHRDFMGLDTVTDVMTFPHGEGQQGGDIAISVERATEHAYELGMAAWEEIRFLAVHGVLHLCGWNDGNDASRQRMLDRQDEIISSWRMG